MAFKGNGPEVTNLNAGNLTSGTVATARLGSGTANSTTYLRGDQTWAAVSTGTPTVQTYDSGTSVTWTKPTTANWLQIELWGGGGSGGGGGGGVGNASGGGGGGYAKIVFPFSDFQGSIVYTVGAGGARTSYNQNGNAGGTTSVVLNTFQGGSAKTISANGGARGVSGSGSDVNTSGGSALTEDGGSGGRGVSGSTGYAGGITKYSGGGGGGLPNGAGGTSVFGGNGGAAGANMSGAGGANGTAPGGGGGAGDYPANPAGGAGGGGRVRFTYW